MANQALYRKYRPQVWDDVVYQEQVTRVLKNAIKTDRVAHAYLFSGPRGTGKTTVARILARAVNCLNEDLDKRPCDECANCLAVNNGQFLDLIEIDAASNTSVDDIRELRDKINFAPGVGRMKVYIIDEVHMLSTAAFNALLKTLEEPPAHAMFILATTEIHKIPATVLSRCQHHEFRRIPVTEIVKRLSKICADEGVTADEAALTLIARQATGAMRDAISMLDQMTAAGNNITLAEAQEILGIATNQAVVDLTEAMINRSHADGMNAIHSALDAGTDPRQFARQTVEYLRQLLVLKMGTTDLVDVTAEIRETMVRQSQKIDIERLVDVVRIFNQAATDSRIDWHPGLNLELAFAESCEEKKSAEQVVKVVEREVIRNVPAQTDPGQGAAAPVDKDLEENIKYVQSRIFIRKGATPDPTVTMKDVAANWGAARKLIRDYDAVLEATMARADLLEVKNGVLYLGFPRETIKKKVEENHRFLVWTSAAISKAIGKSVGISCTIQEPNARRGINNNAPQSEALAAALSMGGQVVVNKK
ncbi:MAG: DNA polymerase III subunit gamma/tau [Anaerolineaceae bacterium]|nr:DNA polymerase III subunit gamma/tau [Anaerolineaceae bacterium]